MTQSAELRRLSRLASSYNTKAERLGVAGRVTGEDLLAIESIEPACHYCHIQLEPGFGSFDHIIPMGQGGKNTTMNITRCCMTCQRRKYTKSEDDYASYRTLTVTCPICGKGFTPRWGEYMRGYGRVCSRSCSASKRWAEA